MDDARARSLRNQMDIMWTLHWLVGKQHPEFVGRGGEVDAIRDDLATSAKATKALLDQS